MLKRPTVLLEHTCRDQRHFDWLLADPGAAGGADSPLWAARTALPSRFWEQCRRFDLELLPPHRRVYLSYQGPVRGDRGWVRRVDTGWVMSRLWTDHAAVLGVRMRGFCGTVALTRVCGPFWRAQVM